MREGEVMSGRERQRENGREGGKKEGEGEEK